MPDLGRFQDAFSRALAGDFAPLAPWIFDDPEAEARFSVYRNTAAKGCADTLAAQFPTVQRVMGEAWMRQAGVVFARAHPPTRASLLEYGADFPAWLEALPEAAETPWLPALARIDWACRDAFFAADTAPLTPAAFAGLSAADYADSATVLHPSASLLWFEAGLPSLWRSLQAEDAPAELELSPEPEGLLVLRPGPAVETHRLSGGAHAFLAACRAGESLAAAACAALAAEPRLPLAETFGELIAAGAFVRLVPFRPEPRP